MHQDYDYYTAQDYLRPPYMRYGPFEILTFFMSCAVGVAILFSCSCAVGYLAELAEEFPTRAKKILHAMAIGVLSVHVLILVIDQLSFWRSLVSIITNVLYLRLLTGFPRCSLTHPLTLLTIASLVVEVVSWYTLLVFTPSLLETVGSYKIVSFIFFLWLMPLGFLVSLEVEPVELPSSSFSASSLRHTDIAASGRKRMMFGMVREWFALATD
ncbi:hypothetical protein TraAM80_07138 [Trypanosoma rangeli]|uniref:Transmembrane adaptor Erv26 n=1 Tax=Trypanosoma rangeli TaxID=5698 RepID=A0A3R7RES4_TRYRA|nr:uncharacterized protein TraAM80_07138 [Trypanosoma rangeli]RNF01237.1 hypothetical protein TraAM80_07138 [Trypanosoma rangeli]|eukprot:RNF01237.1 hypothetical protein TraAM80_07138 [Trypanosoma rangeli]